MATLTKVQAGEWPQGRITRTIMGYIGYGEMRPGDIVLALPNQKPRRGDWVILRGSDGQETVTRVARKYRGIQYLTRWTGTEYQRRALDDGERIVAVVFRLIRELPSLGVPCAPKQETQARADGEPAVAPAEAA